MVWRETDGRVPVGTDSKRPKPEKGLSSGLILARVIIYLLLLLLFLLPVQCSGMLWPSSDPAGLEIRPRTPAYIVCAQLWGLSLRP